MNKSILSLGDILVIAIITLIGFTTHGETNISVLPRVAAVFFPLTIAWFVLAPALGLFQPEIKRDPKQLWRLALGALFAGPMAAIVRGFLLNAPAIPIFAVVLGVTTTIGMLLWRALYLLLRHKAS